MSPARIYFQPAADQHNENIILLKINQQVITVVTCSISELQEHGQRQVNIRNSKKVQDFTIK